MTCPYCFSGLAPHEALACTACRTPLHAECARLHGGCVTLGCGGSRFRLVSALGSSRALQPQLPWRHRWRRYARRLLEVALAPVEDVALGVLGLGGLIFLALLV